MISNVSRFTQALAKFDAANAQDPNQEVFEGKSYPKELIYAQRMTAMLNQFAPDASEAVQLAVRCQHICRWKSPRNAYPMDGVGYKQWRTDLYKFHGETAGALMREAGYDEEMTGKVQALLRKEKLKVNPETQLLEDVVDLVFLQYYLADFVVKYSHYDEEKLLGILRKTWRKMSDKGHEAALKLNYTPEILAVIQKALAAN
ncbi:MAG: hypothetical protein B7Y56_11635 [Gallionellales bacterium 35-53-114]|jgi:hypothetical protein|nr:MAG: hypothetical protein B7Y56_11635 [Gallionellales bacterium 35-53-114]OYZ64743.1 MAG: hypothetical protein B7Y04_02965 [Gallionellales bacterium 24-53-125]OZB07719.1 MAG: hypothetical protein B7X61_14050 [Gallionellales bacterium 39-52-133]HQS58579.1 DUF4202 domain-containing protein [Gallionellaceae bacterium]HQS74920.1 DUF4202 domain-containing protein [Gallionellaceae bacterium]